MEEGKIIITTPTEIRKLFEETIKAIGEQPAYHTAKQAARYLGISESQVHNLINQGKLKCCQPVPGGLLRFTRQQLDTFMQSNHKNVVG